MMHAMRLSMAAGVAFAMALATAAPTASAQDEELREEDLDASLPPEDDAWLDDRYDLEEGAPEYSGDASTAGAEGGADAGAAGSRDARTPAPAAALVALALAAAALVAGRKA